MIAGRKNPAGLKQGLVMVDGKGVTSELRLISAYVVQVDAKKKQKHNILMIFCLLGAFICVVIPG